MSLFFRKIGEGQPLIILHGLFGSGDNWLSHAKELASHFSVYLVDQRNHGQSFHSNEFSYPLMAEDLLDLMDQEGIEKANLIGHSMGGKTILFFGLKNPERVNSMVVADMGIRAYAPHHDDIFSGLFAVDASNCPGRKEAEQRLSEFVKDGDTRQFLLKNLYWIEPGKLAWRFNLPVLKNTIGNIIDAVPPGPLNCRTLFLRGEKSGYIQENEFDSLYQFAPSCSIETIRDAGHWIHAEKPQEFRDAVLRFLMVS
jgi:pimeloyl-ACP methyl ester carboxylesterase